MQEDFSHVTPPKVFISYAWGGESERIAQEVEKALSQNGLEVVRDKSGGLDYKGLIREFMQEIGKGNFVVVVISDKYLRSENCMFEMIEIAKNGDFLQRIYPIILEDAKIYKPVQRVKYLKYWEEQIKELNDALKELQDVGDIADIQQELSFYKEIRRQIAALAGQLKNMNTLTPEMHRNANFQQIYEQIEAEMKAAATFGKKEEKLKEKVQETVVEEKYEFDIFLSFSSKDESFVKEAGAKLRAYGLRVFMSNDSLSREGGKSFFDSINDALNSSNHFLLACTPNSMKSVWVKKEYTTFFSEHHIPSNEERRLLILKGPQFNFKLVPPLLRTIQASSSVDSVVKQLVPSEVEKRREKRRKNTIRNDYNPEPQTIVEKISISWKVRSAIQDVGKGKEAVTFNTSNFRITFSVVNGQPSTYSVIPGGVPNGATPNYNGTTNRGNWTISGDITTGFIVLQDKASINSKVSYFYNHADGTLKLIWTIPQIIDRTEPTYTFVLEQTHNENLNDSKLNFVEVEAKKRKQEFELKNRKEEKAKQEETERKKALEAEESLWTIAVKENTQKAYQAYLDNSILKNHEVEAKDKIAAFEQIIKDEVDWLHTQKLNTLESFEKYYNKQPSGKHKEQAAAKIKEFKTELLKQKEREKEASRLKNEQKEKELWESTKRVNTLEAYENYLAKSELLTYKAEAIAAKDRISTSQKHGNNKNYYWMAIPIILMFILLIWRPWEKDGTSLESISENMVFVKGGTFNMGSNDGRDNEKPIHEVQVGDFYIGKYEVTQAKWRKVMGNDPPELRFKGCDNCPVESVSWEDIQEFLKKLNAQTGQNYRLPTEAEWEYAARGGNKSKGYTYAGSNALAHVAWYYGHSDIKTQPVGQRAPNELGIYDMSGNVSEWCGDWYGEDYYANSPKNNPQGPSKGEYRVRRGGSWNGSKGYCRVAYRNWYDPLDWNYGLGFRVVRGL